MNKENHDLSEKERTERLALVKNTITVKPFEAEGEKTRSVARRIRAQNESPSYNEIVGVLAAHYGVAYEIADCWIEDFHGTAKNNTG